MTTFEPGARVVFTHGLLCSPFSTAFFASNPAPIMTLGLEVLVHEVIEAITTDPLVTLPSREFTVMATGLFALFSERYVGTLFSNALLASLSATRSCGRFGPAIDGTIDARSSSKFSEYRGVADGSCQIP